MSRDLQFLAKGLIRPPLRVDFLFDYAYSRGVKVTIDLPEEALSALRRTPADFVSAMRLAAAVKWYEVGMLSQGKAAELAGVARRKFLESLAEFRVSPFQTTPEELAEEL